MGYTTVFSGGFRLEPALTPAQIETLRAVGRQRHDPNDIAVSGGGLEYDTAGDSTIAVTTYRSSKKTMNTYRGVEHDPSTGAYPSRYCQWTVSDDGETLEWDGGEKFYAYEGWLAYLLRKFFVPWGVAVSGWVDFTREDSGDAGVIVADRDRLLVVHGTRPHEEAKRFGPDATALDGDEGDSDGDEGDSDGDEGDSDGDEGDSDGDEGDGWYVAIDRTFPVAYQRMARVESRDIDGWVRAKGVRDAYKTTYFAGKEEEVFVQERNLARNDVMRIVPGSHSGAWIRPDLAEHLCVKAGMSPADVERAFRGDERSRRCIGSLPTLPDGKACDMLVSARSARPNVPGRAPANELVAAFGDMVVRVCGDFVDASLILASCGTFWKEFTRVSENCDFVRTLVCRRGCEATDLVLFRNEGIRTELTWDVVDGSSGVWVDVDIGAKMAVWLCARTDLPDDVVSVVSAMAKMTGRDANQLLLSTMVTSKVRKTTEKDVRDRLQCLIGGNTEVALGIGIADLVTDNEVIEVKRAKSAVALTQALGQVMLYASLLRHLSPRVHAFGARSELERALKHGHVEKLFTERGVALTLEEIDLACTQS